MSWKTLKVGLKPNLLAHPLVTKHFHESSGGIWVGVYITLKQHFYKKKKTKTLGYIQFLVFNIYFTYKPTEKIKNLELFISKNNQTKQWPKMHKAVMQWK